MKNNKAPIFLTVLLLAATMSKAQLNSTGRDSLFATIAKMDSIFFTAFNNCDTATTKTLFTQDLEFYHDRGGLTNYEQNLQLIRGRCTGAAKVRRELVPGSLEVHPIKDYDAIQIGRHLFYYTPPGKAEVLERHLQVRTHLRVQEPAIENVTRDQL